MSYYGKIELDANRAANSTSFESSLNIYDNWEKFLLGDIRRIRQGFTLLLPSFSLFIKREMFSIYSIKAGTQVKWFIINNTTNVSSLKPWMKSEEEKNVSERFLGHDYVIIQIHFWTSFSDCVRFFKPC